MRLTLLAHAETEGTRDMVFGDGSARLRPGQHAQPWRAGTQCFCGPEPVCRQTAHLVGLTHAEVLDELAGPAFGSWAGQPLADAMEEDPVGVTAWLGDPEVAPHGGESLTAMAVRVGQTLDGYVWPERGGVIVVSPFVARAGLIHALGVSPSAILRAEVAPLGSVTISRHSARWRLTGLDHPRSR